MISSWDKLENLIGNTPLIKINSLSHSSEVEVYAKAEWYNPGGSVKDRAVFNIIKTAEQQGYLKPGKIILDATSGNSGIAYAMIGKIKGYEVHLVVPSNINKERKRTLLIYGAKLIYTNALEGTDGSRKYAQQLAKEKPDLYFYADQYSNNANWQAHYQTTGPEIWTQTNGKITHFVAGLGTSGTFMGTAKFLKSKNPNIKIIAVEPDSPLHGLEGLKHMETATIPKIYDPTFPDTIMHIPTEKGLEMIKTIAYKEGYLIGPSSGAVATAMKILASSLDKGIIVGIFPDSGYRYLSENFWDFL